MMKRLLVVSTLALLFFSVLFSLFYFGVLRFNYPSLSKYPVRGIDVSHHQGRIDWAQVKKQSIDFVYIKATEGNDFIDPRFLQNWQKARANGLTTGAYHFFTFCSPAYEQALNFIRLVPQQSDSLPPVIDIEFMGSCKRKPSVLEYRHQVSEFIALVSEYYKKKVIIYTTYESFAGYLDTQFQQINLWIRDIYRVPRVNRINRHYLFWQYSNRGRLKGIKTFVDLNVFNGDREAFEQLKKPQMD